jgi:RNA polymerase sigma-70 factor (ECF subfamily)
MKTTTTGTGGRRQWFTTTSWTLVEKAQLGSQEALERLCSVYWYPIYAYIRRIGHSPQDAEDLAQGFFYELLEKNYFRAAHRGRGKFRSFLLVSLKYFLENDRDLRTAKKRGGGVPLVSLDDETAEERYAKEPASDVSPERLFDQQWARTVLEQVQAQLREEYRAHGKLELYERLHVFLSEETEMRDYDRIGAQLQMRSGTVAVAVHRLRHRYRELVRQEIACTVASPADIDGEMRHFYAALAG